MGVANVKLTTALEHLVTSYIFIYLMLGNDHTQLRMESMLLMR